jgi:hypothetical protein
VVAGERLPPNEPVPARVRTVLSRGRGRGERRNAERTDGSERHKALAQHVTSPPSEMVPGIGRAFTHRLVAPQAEKVQRPHTQNDALLSAPLGPAGVSARCPLSRAVRQRVSLSPPAQSPGSAD